MLRSTIIVSTFIVASTVGLAMNPNEEKPNERTPDRKDIP